MALCRTLVVGTLFALVFGTYRLSAGGSLAIHTAYGATLAVTLLAIWIFVDRFGDIRRHFSVLSGWFAAVMLLFDWSTSALVVKRELFDGWYAVYPAGLAFQFALAALVGGVMDTVRRRRPA